MTRKKKTRSLKSIHSVKTGSTTKLKKASVTDRQNTNLKSKTKPKSVYQKFLDENPQAAEKQQQNQIAATEKQVKAPAKKPAKQEDAKTKPKQRTDKDDKREDTREPDLLSQLDNKNFNDFY